MKALKNIKNSIIVLLGGIPINDNIVAEKVKKFAKLLKEETERLQEEKEENGLSSLINNYLDESKIIKMEYIKDSHNKEKGSIQQMSFDEIMKRGIRVKPPKNK